MMKITPYKMKTINADILTPIRIFKRLNGRRKCLLESSFDHENKGKYSYIGADPYKEIIGYGNETVIKDLQTGDEKRLKVNALHYIRDHLPKIHIDLPLPFTGGAIGYVGYDAIREFEQIGADLPDELDMPDIHFMLYKNIIVFEHRKETAHILTINIDQDSDEQLTNNITKLEEALHTDGGNMTTKDIDPLHFKSDMEKETFKESVNKAKEYIRQGEAEQIVVSKRMKAVINGDPLSYYRKLRIANPSPYMFYIDFDDYLIIGASPESLIQTSDQKIIANPIAGTRPRGKTEAEDKALTSELLADKKEISEHQMLVNLSKKDLSRVCEHDSITTPVYMNVEKFEHVMHIVSEVHGTLKPDLTSIDALITSLPAGTVSGTPKTRAMQIINELEPIKRGFYGGGIGYIGFNEEINLALAIRSLIIKENVAYLQTGAGVVLDSDPETEFMETLHKARSLTEVNNTY